MSEVYYPDSTYRIQFHKEFSFSNFEKIIPYLKKLGIKTVYASPVAEAAPGSMHGYDGVDQNEINPEIGTKEQLIRIAKELEAQGIHWLQDIVPNHLSFHEKNKWLMDVLMQGEESPYANFFDVDWNHPQFTGKLMVPFPGSELEKILKENDPGEKHYKLCDWRLTDTTINYRRFFTVNSLICINIQDDDVFTPYHVMVKELVEAGVFKGLRIDHIDGLYDPGKYLNDLRKLCGDKTYIVVEKILEPDELLPDEWPVEGNSGYDFLGMVNKLFSNPLAEDILTKFYEEITGDSRPVEEQIEEKKRYILFNQMHGELDNLMRLYRKEISDEVDPGILQESIAKYLVDCPVYRFYGDDFPVMEIDRSKDRNKLKKFYARCMQFTGPLMAKGVEDTLMYTYNRFIGHNEVGDSPVFFGYSPARFHELMQHRQKHWPFSINGSSTHDTKRGEDVRARLHAITDIPNDWISLVRSWMSINSALTHNGMPDINDEYFIYQTLVSSIPFELLQGSVPGEEKKIYKNRIAEYLHKALREAKIHSGWTEPNTTYEDAAIGFAHALIDDTGEFSQSFLPFARQIADAGIHKSLAQLVLKFTCPGIPDIYQGTEFWDLSLVDPDNRRAVDYTLREELLGGKKTSNEFWMDRASAGIKLDLLQKLLAMRTRYSSVLRNGQYLPLKIEGPSANEFIAFARTNETERIIVVVRLYEQGASGQDASVLLPEEYGERLENVLTGETVMVSNRTIVPGSAPLLLRSS